MWIDERGSISNCRCEGKSGIVRLVLVTFFFSLNSVHMHIQHILAHRKGRGGTEYLVQWANCSYLQSTWEPEMGLASAQAALVAYAKKTRKVAIDATNGEI